MSAIKHTKEQQAIFDNSIEITIMFRRFTIILGIFLIFLMLALTVFLPLPSFVKATVSPSPFFNYMSSIHQEYFWPILIFLVASVAFHVWRILSEISELEAHNEKTNIEKLNYLMEKK